MKNFQILSTCEALHMGCTGAGDMPDNAPALVEQLKARVKSWHPTALAYDLAVLALVNITISEYEKTVVSESGFRESPWSMKSEAAKTCEGAELVTPKNPNESDFK